MSIGIWQILVILVIVLIVFGAGRLPTVMGDLGKGIRSFKAGLGGEPEKDGKEDKPFLTSEDKTSEKDDTKPQA